MKKIETKKFLLIVHDNLVKEVVVKSGQRLRADDVWLSTELALKEKPGAKFYTLVWMESGAGVAPEARKETLTQKYIQHHEAIAMCSRDSQAAIESAVFELTHKFKVPYHFFDDREKGWEWLQTLAERSWRNFETPHFKMIIHDNLLKELYVKDGIEFDVNDMKQSVEMSEKYKPGSKYFTILYEGEGSSVSLVARRAAGHDNYEKHTAAFAICSKNLDVAIRGKLFEKMYQPRIPFHFFDDNEKAIS